MKNKIVTHFYVKESWKDKNGEAPIYLRITVNGESGKIGHIDHPSPFLRDYGVTGFVYCNNVCFLVHNGVMQ